MSSSVKHKSFIAIVDYGVGNLKSVENALNFLGLAGRVTDDPAELERADALILPGVGAFPDAARRLRERGLDGVVRAQAARKPLLGICLGMQLLFDRGEEGGAHPGLGLVEGRVGRIETEEKLPHVGWNSLNLQGAAPLFRGLPPESYVYFVHSYCAYPAREADVIARTAYGASVVAAVARGNVYGCQFHPEKSGEAGLLMLKNFGELNR